MDRHALLRQWCEAKTVTGGLALLWAIDAVAVPTALRAAVDDVVTGVGVTPYFPFVILSAILLGWRLATLVAVVSAAVGDTLFIGSPSRFLEGPSDLFAVGAFLIASAMIIIFAQAVRSLVADIQRRSGSRGLAGAVIFSLEKGNAWASWYGRAVPVRLGPQEEVEAGMKDFLAQVELGKRLFHRRRQLGGARVPRQRQRANGGSEVSPCARFSPHPRSP
jgi:hypothetical protein